MLPVLKKNRIFSSAVHRSSDIKNVRTIFETLDIRLLDAPCVVDTKGKMMSDRSIRRGSGEKIAFDLENRN